MDDLTSRAAQGWMKNMRLIDADKLIEKIEKDKFTYTMTYYQSGYNDGLFHVGVVVDNFPIINTVRDIPKAPTDKQLEEDGYGAWGSLYGRCPNCKESVYEEQNYCEKCGQRLDWGNGDKEIDAVPVIRCRECKHCNEAVALLSLPLMYKCARTGEPVRTDDYCSRAERKEE